MSFRYSAINTAHSCLTKYKLQYVDQVAVEGAPSLALEFGTAMHTALQALFEGDDPLKVFTAYWDTLAGKEFGADRFTPEALRTMAETFLSRFQRLHAKNFEPFKIEERISGELGGYPIEGTPDMLGNYKGKRSVIDFKTSNYAYPKEKILINEQMPIYAKLAEKAYGYQAEQLVYVVFIKAEMRIQIIIVPLTKSLLDNAIKNVIIMMSDLTTRKEFPRNPNSCVMGATYKCAYFDYCHGGNDD